MKSKWMRFGTCVFLFLLIFSPSLMAQTSATGALAGTVTDPSGAIIPNVTVTVTSAETGQVRTTNTRGDGSYSIGLLPPGSYRVRFEASGFKAVEVPAVTVTVTETGTLNQSLTVGTQTQEVTVQANVETVQTSSSAVGTVIGGKTVTDIPLATRNYMDLLALSAGTSSAVVNATTIGKGTPVVATGGASTGSNNFQMDGASIVNFNSVNDGQESGTHGGIGIPNPDAVQEFKIQTSQYDAAYGQQVGANVNVVTKSGTNDWHGTAFEFLRQSIFNASDWFSDFKGLPKPVLNQNQFGGTVGGPVKKDKLFFFVSFQETEQKNGYVSGSTNGSNSTVLPPLPQANVNNRGTCPAGATAITQCNAAAQTYAAELGAMYAGKAGTFGGQAVLANGSNISPVALNILTTQLPGGQYYFPNTGSAIDALFVQQSQAIYHEYQGVGNWDYVINSKNTLSGRYFYATDPEDIPFYGTTNVLAGFPGKPQWTNDEAVLKLTTIVSNNFVNEVRASYQRNISLDKIQSPIAASQVGICPLSASSCASPAPFPQLPTITLAGASGLGGPSLSASLGTYNFGVANNTINQYQGADQISWTHGKHTIRAGFEVAYFRWNWNFPGLSIGSYGFNSFPDFLLGMPGACGPSVPGVCNGSNNSNVGSVSAGATKYIPGPYGADNHYADLDYDSYVQDDIRVTQRLTLNLGLRWELDSPVWEYNGRNTNYWPNLIATDPYPYVTTPCTGVVFPTPCTATSNGGLGGSYVGFVIPNNYNYAALPAVPPGVFTNNRKIATQNGVPLDDFGPRVGFAFQPLRGSSKWVLRGGFGVFFDRLPGEDYIHSVLQQVPYALTQGLTPAASLANPWLPAQAGWQPRWFTVTNGGAPGCPLASVQCASSSLLSAINVQPIFKTPTVYSWSLGSQYEFLPTWVFELGYVGSRGTHQFYSDYINPPSLASAGNPVNCGYDGNPADCITGTTPSNVAARVPLLGWAQNIASESSAGDFQFNSLLATVRKQFSHGLTFQAAYTWSRAFVMSQVGINANYPLAQEYGQNTVYHPQRLAINYSYTLPIPKMDGIAGKLTEGWSVSGVTTIQDGTPLTITDGSSATAFGVPAPGTAEANFCPGVNRSAVPTSGSMDSRVINGYINTTGVFCQAPHVGSAGGFGYGQSGLGILLGPGQNNWDISIIKNTVVGGIHEGAILQFRAEFFNAFNHPQFSNPGTSIRFSTAGVLTTPPAPITTLSVNPRLIQFALKYQF